MSLRKCFEFTGEERFFQGHFPEAPILPGVVQLELAQRAAEELCGRPLVLKAVKKMKFVRVISPHRKVELEVAEEQGGVSYRWTEGGETCSSGVLVY